MSINRLIVRGGGRNYSVDLLKIFSMIMVVILHLNLFGGLLTSADQSDSFPFRFTVNLFEEICIIAVDVFIIISSWFLSASNGYSLKTKRVVRLIVSMFFWYLVMTAVAFLLGVRPGYKELLFSLPIIGKSYDFITGYLILYLLSPYLNRLIHHLNQRTHKRLSIILALIFCLFAPIIANQYAMVYKGYSFAWFICIYLIVSYVRIYTRWSDVSWKWYFTCFVSLTLMGALVRCFVPEEIPLYVTKGHYNDPIVFSSAVSCFLLFASFTIKKRTSVKLIEFFVPLSVAVFFIHANMFIEQWFKSLSFYIFINDNPFRYLIIIPLLAVSIYLAGTICEFIREKLFDRLGLNQLLDKFSLIIDNCFSD